MSDAAAKTYFPVGGRMAGLLLLLFVLISAAAIATDIASPRERTPKVPATSTQR